MQDCDKADYETWTPLSPTGGCLLGRRLSLQRRKQDAQCFNGIDHENAEVHEEICACEMVRSSAIPLCVLRSDVASRQCKGVPAHACCLWEAH